MLALPEPRINRLLKMEKHLDILISEKKEYLEFVNKKINCIKLISNQTEEYSLWLRERIWVTQIIYELEEVKGKQ